MEDIDIVNFSVSLPPELEAVHVQILGEKEIPNLGGRSLVFSTLLSHVANLVRFVLPLLLKVDVSN